MSLAALKSERVASASTAEVRPAESASGAPVEAVAGVVTGLKSLMLAADPTTRDISFSNVARAAGGLSRENWSLEARWTDARGAHAEQLMLMRDAAGTLLPTDRAREFAVLKALDGAGLPAPRAHWLDPDGRHLGAPSMVMQRMPGVCDYLVLNGERPLPARLALARDFLALMTAIHALDWRACGLGGVLGEPEVAPSRAELSRWEGEYRRVQLEAHPELDVALTWMRRRAPDAEAVVLVHGDFKPGNALVGDAGIVAKLDWETAHLGDPLEDLGWVTNPVRRREHQIEGLWERKEIIAAYRERTGRDVDEAALTWWNVFAIWKLAIIQLTAVAEFVAGRYNRVFQTPSWLYRPMFQLMEKAP